MNLRFEGLPPALQQRLEEVCESQSALCPEIFSSTWERRKEHFTGSALDGLLPLHMAQRHLRLGIVGKELSDFISFIPGYSNLTSYFQSEKALKDYLSNQDYGFQQPALFGAIVVQSAATCLDGVCSGDWDIVIHLNTTGPSTSTDMNGATDINTKLIPEVNWLSKGLDMSHSRVYWSGGLSRNPLTLPTGGLIDLQSLVFAWIFNSTGAYEMPQLPQCRCLDDLGHATEDITKCNSSQQLSLAIRSLTPLCYPFLS